MIRQLTCRLTIKLFTAEPATHIFAVKVHRHFWRKLSWSCFCRTPYSSRRSVFNDELHTLSVSGLNNIFAGFSHSYHDYKSLSKSRETQLELKKRKEAKRLERLDRQRIRVENVTEKSDSVAYTHSGVPGSIKDTSSPLPSTYSPEYVEAAWYDWWLKEGFLSPEYNSKASRDVERFVICLPPPNITGTLHLGHAMGNSVEDALVRWHRMQGHVTLWNPGCDHAGIATQTVVEQRLWRERKLSRFDLGRERFTEEVLKWKDDTRKYAIARIHSSFLNYVSVNRSEVGEGTDYTESVKNKFVSQDVLDHIPGKIYDQMKQMGLSLDWSRVCFTMDPKLNRAVNEAFIRLFDSGAIYRNKRLVNWSCALRSAISDIEVENISLSGKTYLDVPGYKKPVPFGLLNFFAYPVDGSEEEVVVATTRLETMLGDVAVAVNPSDARYLHLHGRRVRHPIDTTRTLPVITDSKVDMTFGTGVVKVTPSHDNFDFELARRHNLPHLNILSDDGTLVNVLPMFTNVKRFDARNSVQKLLEDSGLFRGQQEHAMVLPVCSRSKDIIEFLLKDQWFLECKDMSQKAIQAVTSGKLTLIPGHYQKQWTDWLESTGDWCISRQLWWGHRIPVYRIKGHPRLQTESVEDVWVAAHDRQEALQKAVLKIARPIEELDVEQDVDVLDTWFSSALFPFSIFGWPDQTDDLMTYYPTSLLETASDIMFFWVARMVMLGKKLTGQLPFKQVLFHSILRDAQGRKMSKSLGNVIDPMHVIHGVALQELVNAVEVSNLSPAEITKAKQGLRVDYPLGIPQCGADALRFTLCSYDFTAHVVNVDVSHIKANRNFCNKIWQAFRFFNMHVLDGFQPIDVKQMMDSLSPTDRWILSRLADVVGVCDTGFRSFNLTQVTRSLHSFWWSELCDVYLEYLKSVIQTQSNEEILKSKSVLHLCIDTGLRLLSPFMPFLTEELYQRLPGVKPAPSIMVASYPSPSEYTYVDVKLEQDMQLIRDISSDVLLMRKDLNLTKEKAELFIESNNDNVRRAVRQQHVALLSLSRCKNVTFVEQCDSALLFREQCVSLVFSRESTTLHVLLQGVIDSQKTLAQLRRQKEIMEQELRKLEQINKSDELHRLSTEFDKMDVTKTNIRRISNLIQCVDKFK